MSDFELLVAESAIEEIENLPEASQSAVEEAIDRLVTNPISAGMRLKGVGSKNRSLYTMRVGQNRVMYSVDQDLNRVTVVKIASRQGLGV